MTALNSLTSTMKLGPQASKGTALATNLLCGRFTTSNMQPVFDYIEADAEHFCGIAARATVRKTASRIGGYVVPFGGLGSLYPNFLGMILLGMGFKASTAGAGAAKTHTFTIDDVANAKWMTALQNMGDGADAFERRVTDGRIETLRWDASVRGIQQAFAGYGITEDAAAGTEESVNEEDAMLLPSKGSATVSIGGQAFTSKFRGLRFLINNPLDRNQQDMFAVKRSDLPPTGIEAGGSLQRLDIDYTTYKRLNWGGASGTGPASTSVTGAVTFKFEAAEIVEATTPYSVEVILPSVEFRMGQFQASGRDLIRFDLAFLMVDNVSEPITIKIVNKLAGYPIPAA